MQGFTLFVIVCVMLSDFIVKTLQLPPPMRFIPELLSGALVVYVLIAGTRDRFRLVAAKYWITFAALAIVILCGIINSGTGSGPIISGMRFYLRAAPMFFLPAVLPMTEDRLERQLKWLLGLSLIQLPVAGYQRWVIIAADRYSGDDVRGTLMDSGILSMYLISAVLVMTGLLMKRRISKFWYTVLFFLLLIPTAINETKVTVIMLPFGLVTALILGADRGNRLRYAGMTLIALIAFGALFIPVYDSLEAHNHYKTKLVDFFTDERQLDRYLAAGGKEHGTGIGGSKPSHRMDGIVVPIKYLARDPVTLAFGLGLGNVSPSNLGKNFEGAYVGLFRSLLVTSFSYFILEFGVVGVILIGCLYWMIFSDTLFVARSDGGLTGAIAAGWTGVVAIFLLAVIYNTFYQFASVTYLYWYFAGVVCARRMALNLSGEAARYPARLESAAATALPRRWA
jgi:hypothetical protein